MDATLVGYIASGTSVAAFGSQFLHILRYKTTEGVSLTRTVFDAISLALWVFYATRNEDVPLLIATSLELVTSCALCFIVIRHRKAVSVSMRLKKLTPPSTPPYLTEDAPILIHVRAASVLPLTAVSVLDLPPRLS